MAPWRLVVEPKKSGNFHMSVDLQLFHDFEADRLPSTLRIYSWQPRCISVGYSQNLVNKPGWDCVKRPTGGGIVFHNEAEITYSIVTAIDNPLLPKGLIPSYKKISEAVVYALGEIGIFAEILNSKHQIPSKSKAQNPKSQLCFSFPAEYEIVVEGRKIVGSAQKRGKRALLQQGSIFMKRDALGDLREAICVEEMLGRVVCFEEMSEALRRGFKEALGVRFEN